MSCVGCHSCGGCAVDCYWAPWNFDKPVASRMVHLMRLVRWLRRDGHSYSRSGPLGFTLSDFKWTGDAEAEERRARGRV